MASITVAKSISGYQSEDVHAEILFCVKNMPGIAFSAFRTEQSSAGSPADEDPEEIAAYPGHTS